MAYPPESFGMSQNHCQPYLNLHCPHQVFRPVCAQEKRRRKSSSPVCRHMKVKWEGGETGSKAKALFNKSLDTDEDGEYF